MALAIYAAKSGISREELEKDAFALIPYLDGLVKNDPFTKEDCLSALECYDHRYKTFPKKDIQKITGITIPERKRNKRKQGDHLRRARLVQMDDYPNGEWRKGNGRKSKEELVIEFIKNHPGKSVTEIARELGVSRPTVYKYKKDL
jgi:DNA-binding NarL/FixJ family response regulator